MNRRRGAGLQQRASRVIPLGVNSNSRYWGEGRNLYIERARGAYVWDVDGNRYLDYRLAFGPLILGYACDEVDEQVIAAIRSGTASGLTIELEIQAAEKVSALCPGVEMVRFVNSGSEASQYALRLARAYTGREKFIKFEGGYHGSHDHVLFSTYTPPEAYGSRFAPIPIPASSGIPAALRRLVIPLQFNDLEALEKTLASRGNEVAAILTEPMLGNYGSVDPAPRFMDALRRLCDRYGCLLILDEVKTGFRVAAGGAAELYGIRPDLALYAKSMGNGYPVAAFGGRREIMTQLGRGVSQGGTYAGHAVGVAAVNATLGILQTRPVHAALNSLGGNLQTGLAQIFQSAGLRAAISRLPAIFSISFGVDAVENGRDWAASDQPFYRRFAQSLLDAGILIDPDPREPWCLSYAHTADDIEFTLETVETVIRDL